MGLVGPALKARTRVLYIEDVLEQLARIPETAWYGLLLAEKYDPDARAAAGPFSGVLPS
jgi:hypothetical protein